MDFIVPEAKLTFEHDYFAKFHFHHFHFVFPRTKYLTGHRYFHKSGVYCALTSKKIKSITDRHLFKLNENEIDQMVRNDIACNCIPIISIAFWYAHISFQLLFG